MGRELDINLPVIYDNMDILLRCGALSLIDSIAKEGKVRETQELLDKLTEKELVKEKEEGLVFTEEGRELYESTQKIKEWNRSGMTELENITILVRRYRNLSKDLYKSQLSDAEISLVKGREELLNAIENKDIGVVIIERFLKDEIGGLVDDIRERSPQMPVVVITTVRSDRELLDQGVDDYLVKPIAADELRRAVSRSIKIRHLPLRRRQLLFLLAQKTDLEEEYSNHELKANLHYRKVVQDLRRISEGDLSPAGHLIS